jgi:hypothetical protein
VLLLRIVQSSAEMPEGGENAASMQKLAQRVNAVDLLSTPSRNVLFSAK